MATLRLSWRKDFDHVLATEIAKISVNSALENFKANKVNNVTVARLSSEEFTQALNREVTISSTR